MTRGKDHLRRSLLLMGAGVLALAVALGGLVLGAPNAQAQAMPGATYAGTVDVITPDVCGGGTIGLTIDGTGANIVQIVLDGTIVGGVLVNTVATPPGGPLVVDPAPPIAVAGDGTFDTTFQPLAGVDATFSGQFTGDMVTGTFGVAVLQCTGVTFSAQVAGVGVTPTPSPTATEPAPTATVLATALPSTGNGPTTTDGSGSNPGLWIALAVLGVASLGAGAVLVGRRAL